MSGVLTYISATVFRNDLSEHVLLSRELDDLIHDATAVA